MADRHRLNLCRRALQDRARWARLDGAEPAAGGPGPQEAAEAAAIAERVRARCGASVLAEEARARLAQRERELAELNEPGASPP